MNDWYIDRSKNFINDSLKQMLQFFLVHCQSAISSTELVRLMGESGVLGRAEGNPNAALTRYRDHGFLRKNNIIGDSARDYLNGQIGAAELVIDMFSKRPAKKTNSPNVKPFFVLCMIFDIMQQNIMDTDDIFITYEEVKEYLFPIDSYSDITYDLVDRIVSEREYEYNSKMPKTRVHLDNNEDTNLSIWFNALQHTPLFMPSDGSRNVLRPNLKQKEFFRFVAVNAEEVSQTHTENNEELYNYYCDGNTGIAEIIPNVVKSSGVITNDTDAQILYEYLFGYKKVQGFNYSRFLRYECFGLFFPFITIPKIVLRNIIRNNEQIGSKLYEFVTVSHGYLEKFNEEDIEYKSNDYRKEIFDDILSKNAIGIHIKKQSSALSPDNPHICIGWSALGDLSGISSKQELADLYSISYPDRAERSKGQDVGQIWTFLDKLGVGDYAIYGDGKTAHIGKVTSKYYFDDNCVGQDQDYVNNKKVKWLKSVLYSDLPVGLRSAFFAPRSVFSLNEYRSALLELLKGKVLDKDECEEGEDSMDLLIRKPRTYKALPLNFILYGAPGTGKTYITADYALSIINHVETPTFSSTPEERMALMEKYNSLIKDGRIVFTTFHQSYGYEDFIQGLRPDTSSGTLEFKTIDGVFKAIADRAMKDLENEYVIIIDEINRANISKVFGELITLIEEDKRWGEKNAISVTLPSGELFAVPNNLYIIGTMNSADKSISLIDSALRRRFEFVEITPRYDVVEDSKMREILERLNIGLADELDSTDLLIGHAYFIGKSCNELCTVMNRSIIPLLYEYFYDNAKKVKDLVNKAIEGYEFEIVDVKVGRIKLVEKTDKE